MKENELLKEIMKMRSYDSVESNNVKKKLVEELNLINEKYDEVQQC